MKTQMISSAVIAALILSGCASRASSVAPVSISANDYSGLSCADSREQLQTARLRENALVRRQNNAAVADAASVFLVLLPLGSVFGADVAGELAQAKGETLALERHIRSRCDRPQYEEGAAQAAGTITRAPAPASKPQPSTRACGVLPQANGGNKLVPCR